MNFRIYYTAGANMGSANYSNWRESSIGRGRRKIGTRETRRTIRIVVEGEKTEKIYFGEIRKLADLTAMEVKVIHCTKGTSATQIVAEGIKILEQQDPRIDEVWCVFDQESKEEEKDFRRAIRMQKDTAFPEGKKLYCAISNPCFEFWMLLHFEKTDRPFVRCLDVLRDLKKKVPNYHKSNGFEIKKICILASVAVASAQWLRERNVSCPMTDVDRLMIALSKDKFSNTPNMDT
jgi:hypothetical protein